MLIAIDEKILETLSRWKELVIDNKILKHLVDRKNFRDSWLTKDNEAKEHDVQRQFPDCRLDIPLPEEKDKTVFCILFGRASIFTRPYW